MAYKDLATDLYNMAHSGQAMEAFEKFYHEDTVMVEATGDIREGKDTNREFEKN